ncbi:hypothetical protein D1872_156710 [compost metagenome]
MRKKLLTSLIFFLISVSLFDSPISANEMYALDNYFAVHSNKAGTAQRLKDKRGDAILYGDTLEHDAQIISVSFVKEGLQPGEKLYIIHPDGSKQTVTGDTVNLSPKSENIRIAIDKTTNKETLVKVLMMTVKDASDGGTMVDYLYTKDTPMKYGDLGDGAGGGGTDPGGGVTGIDLQWNAGTRRFTWTKWPSDAYQIVVTDPDGKKVNVTPSTKVFKADERAGTYKFEVKDMNGKVLYTKSMTVPAGETDPGGGDPPDPDPGGGDPPDPDPGGEDPGPDPGGETPCTKNGCDFINEVLACPGWDEVMGDLTGAIRDAMPPPPDWDMVADKIGRATIDHLSDYMGSVPSPPSESEIQANTQTPQPQYDVSSLSQTITPKVPEEYNKGKIVFELNNGPEIEVKDESKPFRIDDPIANIKQKSDPVGQGVIPGDPKNHSDGIKQPDRLDLGGPPKPKTEPSPNPVPGPSPNIPSSPAPVPSNPGGGAANPDVTEGPIPIPKGGE